MARTSCTINSKERQLLKERVAKRAGNVEEMAPAVDAVVKSWVEEKKELRAAIEAEAVQVFCPWRRPVSRSRSHAFTRSRRSFMVPRYCSLVFRRQVSEDQEVELQKRLWEATPAAAAGGSSAAGADERDARRLPCIESSGTSFDVADDRE